VRSRAKATTARRVKLSNTHVVANISRDLLDDPATPVRLRVAFDAASTPAGARLDGFALVDASPGTAAWVVFLRQALLLLGAALVLAGAISFFAFNWASLGRFGKFAIIGGAILAAALGGWRFLDRLAGKVALSAAAVLVGPLLAVYGQTYQTGADPWGLFAGWAVLIAPWVIAARFTPLWAIAITLVDVALVLFWIQVADFSGPWELMIFLELAAVHAVAVVAWEWQRAREEPWLEEAWAPRLLVATGFTALMVPAVVLIIDSRDAGEAGVLALFALALTLVAAFWYYRHVREDLFMLTAACGTIAVFVTMAVGRVLLGELDLGVLGPLLMACLLIAEVATAVTWLRHVIKERAR
jgi:uncharacterized membrane protein